MEGSEQSWDCGGTSHVLPQERKRATFSVSRMMEILDGGKKGGSNLEAFPKTNLKFEICQYRESFCEGEIKRNPLAIETHF